MILSNENQKSTKSPNHKESAVQTRYPKYKPSGVEWIGEIPEHWDLATVGRLNNLGRGRVISALEIGVNGGDYPVYSSQTENDGIMGYLNTYDFEGAYVTWTTDGANAGTVFYREGKFNCTNVCGTMRPKNWEQIDLKYLPYFLNLGTKFSVRLDINPKLMNNMMAKIPLVIPPKSEQTAIANYLDDKTVQIDSLIEKKRKLIELLKEERAAIINEAVTKGLNRDLPDLHDLLDSQKIQTSNHDNQVNPKNQGSDSFPGHWEVKKLKYVAKLKSGESITTDNIRGEEKYPVYGGNGLRGFAAEYTHDGDYILIGRQGALCGNINYASGKFWASEHAIVVTRFNEENIVWLGELLKGMNLNQYSILAAQPGLSVERIQNLLIPYPPLEEQKIIGNHIQTETKRIDSTVSKIETEIKLLQEYRTALISEVVTGKIKV